jgi:hypothetical protein
MESPSDEWMSAMSILKGCSMFVDYVKFNTSNPRFDCLSTYFNYGIIPSPDQVWNDIGSVISRSRNEVGISQWITSLLAMLKTVSSENKDVSWKSLQGVVHCQKSLTMVDFDTKILSMFPIYQDGVCNVLSNDISDFHPSYEYDMNMKSMFVVQVLHICSKDETVIQEQRVVVNISDEISVENILQSSNKRCSKCNKKIKEKRIYNLPRYLIFNLRNVPKIHYNISLNIPTACSEIRLIPDEKLDEYSLVSVTRKQFDKYHVHNIPLHSKGVSYIDNSTNDIHLVCYTRKPSSEMKGGSATDDCDILLNSECENSEFQDLIGSGSDYYYEELI